MKTSIGKYFLLVISIALFLSCSKKAIVIPPDVIPEKQMIEVMTDVHLAEATKNLPLLPQDTSTHAISEYYNFIFNKYHITKDKFQKKFDFYKSNPELMEEVYSEVLSRLSEMQAKQINH